MRRQFLEIVQSGGDGLKPIVIEAAPEIRRPSQPVTPEPPKPTPTSAGDGLTLPS